MNGDVVVERYVTGEIKPTNKFIDGKQVFVKRIYIPQLPNTTNQNYNIGLPSGVTIQNLDGYYKNNSSPEYFFINYLSSSGNYDIGTYINSSGLLTIVTKSNRDTYHGYVNVYFTYN